MNQRVQAFCQRYFVDRRGTDCKKWDQTEQLFGVPNLLGMWIADMEFKVPEAVQEALQQRVDHGVFGYSYPTAAYFDAFRQWQAQQAGVQIRDEWIRFSPGVVNSFYWLVQMLTAQEETVLIMPPVYPPFHGAVKQTGRSLVKFDLQLIKGRYELDFEALEASNVSEEVKAIIHCSPHNPTGRLWSFEELERLLQICQRHQVYLICDEIHQDFVAAGHHFVSALDERLAAYRDRLVVLNAPSKTFNLAGLLNSHLIIPDSALRQRYDQEIQAFNQASHSLMGLLASQAAYETGKTWLEGLNATIDHNDRYIRQHLLEDFPLLRIAKREATYVVFIDLGAYLEADQIQDFMVQEVGVAVNFGASFSHKTATFIRINCATHPDYIVEACDRLNAALSARQA